jgi:hypothetical protein
MAFVSGNIGITVEGGAREETTGRDIFSLEPHALVELPAVGYVCECTCFYSVPNLNVHFHCSCVFHIIRSFIPFL